MTQLINEVLLMARKSEMLALIKYANLRVAEIDIQLKQINEEQTDEH